MAIQASELRIGNWVYTFAEYTPLSGMESREGFSHPVQVISKMFSYGFDLYTPIPLTPEILEMCGFEIIYHNPRLEYFYVNKQSYYPFFVYIQRDNLVFYNENLHIKSVHQLQNLYFALTGIELEINL